MFCKCFQIAASGQGVESRFVTALGVSVVMSPIGLDPAKFVSEILPRTSILTRLHPHSLWSRHFNGFIPCWANFAPSFPKQNASIPSSPSCCWRRVSIISSILGGDEFSARPVWIIRCSSNVPILLGYAWWSLSK